MSGVDSKLSLVAYLIDGEQAPSIRSNAAKRAWIERDTARNGYRCLPLGMASGLGWSLLSPFTFEVEYDGRHLFVRSPERSADPTALVADQFGGGVFTFFVSALFRTPPKHNLFVTGPLNAPKRGAAALSALIETDWLEATFTMNWKITELDYPVTFEKDEPFCTFFPYPRHYAESFEPVLRDLNEVPELERRHRAWLSNRLLTLSPEGSYMRGAHFVDEGQPACESHQRSLAVREFRDERRGSERERSSK